MEVGMSSSRSVKSHHGQGTTYITDMRMSAHEPVFAAVPASKILLPSNHVLAWNVGDGRSSCWILDSRVLR